jgi:hypothetical protein
MDSRSCSSTKKFPHIVLIRTSALLLMQYKAEDLADELGIAKRTLRDWLNQGVLHQGEVIPECALPNEAGDPIIDFWTNLMGIGSYEAVSELLDILGVDK